MRHIRLSKTELRLVAEEPLSLPPYKGSTFRGAFGHAFKRVVCSLRGRDCAECPLKAACLYSYVFETPPAEDAEMLRRYPRAPHPFIVEPPPTGQTRFDPGETLTANLILVGKAIENLPYFVYTFIDMAKNGLGSRRGRCRLASAHACAVDGSAHEIYSESTDTISKNHPLITVADAPTMGDASRLTLNFHTPTRLKFSGSLCDTPFFHVIIRSLLRRLSSLAYFHCGQKLDLDFRGLIRRAEAVELSTDRTRWHDWERFSSRQRTRMKLGGFLGTASYRGPVGEFLPFLWIGQYTHVGKAATFGLGQYTIASDEV